MCGLSHCRSGHALGAVDFREHAMVYDLISKGVADLILHKWISAKERIRAFTAVRKQDSLIRWRRTRSSTAGEWADLLKILFRDLFCRKPARVTRLDPGRVIRSTCCRALHHDHRQSLARASDGRVGALTSKSTVRLPA